MAAAETYFPRPPTTLMTATQANTVPTPTTTNRGVSAVVPVSAPSTVDRLSRPRATGITPSATYSPRVIRSPRTSVMTSSVVATPAAKAGWETDTGARPRETIRPMLPSAANTQPRTHFGLPSSTLAR